MKKVLAVTTNFGFGPVSKLCAILKGILKKYGDQVEVTYYGSGESLNFIRRNLGDSVLYEYADSDSVEEKMFDSFIDGSEFNLLVNVMNLNIIKMMSNLSIKNIFVDSLNWMWPESIEGIDCCDMYIIQNCFLEQGNKGKNANEVIVNPILDLDFPAGIVQKKSKNIILINFSGIITPDNKDNFFIEYVSYYLNIFSEISVIERYKVICACNSKQLEYLKNLKFEDIDIVFTELTHEKFLEIARVASKIFSTPGLTFYLESRVLDIDVYYLLPSNYSQALLMERYRREGIRCNSLSSFGGEYTLKERMDESAGVVKVRKNFSKIKRKFFKQIKEDMFNYIVSNSRGGIQNKAMKADGVTQILNKLSNKDLL